MSNATLVLIISVMSLAFPFSAHSVTEGELRTYATRNSIGIEWDVTDDTNHNAECQVRFRVAGSSTWKTALPLYRVDFKGDNMMAGSIFYLQPGVSYELELSLSDVDGGAISRRVHQSTLEVPQLPRGGRVFYVSPGTGGGDGSSADPFKGIAAAEANASPGDTFILRPGLYPGETEFTRSGRAGNYIVWRGVDSGRTILDNIRISADHIWIQGVHVEGDRYGIRTYYSPQDVVIAGNSFKDCHYCIYLNKGGDSWYIVDNSIYGDVEPSSGDFGGEGIELNHTDNHTVAFNSITHVADGISYPGSNCDIFSNEIFDVSDDGIEPDYGTSNNRVWGNRISNALHNGISFQPMNGAPWYIFRNQVAAPLESGLKFRDAVDRALIAHNTFVGWQGAQKSGSNFLLSVQSNNNLWISMTDWYAWENGSGGTPNWKTDLDYDGFDWGDNYYAIKWGDRYRNLKEFSQATGLQNNSIRISKDLCFPNLNIPNKPPAPMAFQHLSLSPHCNAIDYGKRLANINDTFLGSAPDLGAYEFGAELPHYGPRSSTPPTPGPGQFTLPPTLTPLLLKN